MKKKLKDTIHIITTLLQEKYKTTPLTEIILIVKRFHIELSKISSGLISNQNSNRKHLEALDVLSLHCQRTLEQGVRDFKMIVEMIIRECSVLSITTEQKSTYTFNENEIHDLKERAASRKIIIDYSSNSSINKLACEAQV